MKNYLNYGLMGTLVLSGSLAHTMNWQQNSQNQDIKKQIIVISSKDNNTIVWIPVVGKNGKTDYILASISDSILNQSTITKETIIDNKRKNLVAYISLSSPKSPLPNGLFCWRSDNPDIDKIIGNDFLKTMLIGNRKVDTYTYRTLSHILATPNDIPGINGRQTFPEFLLPIAYYFDSEKKGFFSHIHSELSDTTIYSLYHEPKESVLFPLCKEEKKVIENDLTRFFAELTNAHNNSKPISGVIGQKFYAFLTNLNPENRTDLNTLENVKKEFSIYAQKMYAMIDPQMAYTIFAENREFFQRSAIRSAEQLKTKLSIYAQEFKTKYATFDSSFTSKINEVRKKTSVIYQQLSQYTDKDACNKAYRKLALQLHPDKHPDERSKYEALFKELGDTYETIKQEKGW